MPEPGIVSAGSCTDRVPEAFAGGSGDPGSPPTVIVYRIVALAKLPGRRQSVGVRKEDRPLLFTCQAGFPVAPPKGTVLEGLC